MIAFDVTVILNWMTVLAGFRPCIAFLPLYSFGGIENEKTSIQQCQADKNFLFHHFPLTPPLALSCK
jgi:hypothetical protein